ncbi:MAG: DegV family protein [Candidatus Pacebacteria bacterium]|nr:DegV family protein [Candidatus Paceibacterota bacterium]
MKKIGITTDSASDLKEDIIKKFNIGVAKFHVDLQAIKDFSGNIFEKMRKAEEEGINSEVKTSQPSIAEYINVFKKALENFEEIIHVSVSSKVSGAYNSAMQAKRFLGKDGERVHVLDSETASGAQALLIVKALEDIEKQLRIEEIINNFNKRIKDTFLFFMYDNPKWLKSGGRFPSLAALGLQKIRAMNIGIVMREKGGVIRPMAVKKNIRGLAEPLFDEFKKFTRNTQKKIKVIITHADNPNEAKKLETLLSPLQNVNVLYSSIMDIVLGAHAGPNTLLINFIYE